MSLEPPIHLCSECHGFGIREHYCYQCDRDYSPKKHYTHDPGCYLTRYVCRNCAGSGTLEGQVRQRFLPPAAD